MVSISGVVETYLLSKHAHKYGIGAGSFGKMLHCWASGETEEGTLWSSWSRSRTCTTSQSLPHTSLVSQSDHDISFQP